MSVIDDAAQRQQALDSRRSFIVQAPAGSGKTELLIRRLLALLAVVDRPEAILAITFTRKAAAEMRHRLLEALAAAEGPDPADEHARQTLLLARRALERDRCQGWNLLRNPSRLQIQTIDSFNASLVRRMPWLVRLGAMPEMTEESAPLCRQAAEQLLSRLERNQAGGEALLTLLAHLDNRLDRLRDMLAELLQRRDQWLRHLLADDGRRRDRLEEAAARLAEAELRNLADRLPDGTLATLVRLGAYAGSQLPPDHPDAACLAGLHQPPPPRREALSQWQALARLLVTADGKGFRKRVDARQGFPPGRDPQARAMKAEFVRLTEELAAVEGLAADFHRLHGWHRLGFDDGQWQVLAALLDLLPLAVQQLWRFFRREGCADFAEIALRSLGALQHEEGPSELLLRLDTSLQHILVDEFQDTSHLQFSLLQRLTEGWQPGDGRTLFLVGDPMQSIYRFREAEVGLFLRARRQGLGTVPLEPLTLTSNFRSQAGVVDWVNASFRQLFPAHEDAFRGAVSYAPCRAVKAALPAAAVRLLPQVGRDDAAEARQLAEELQATLERHPGDSVAVLVRARPHLRELVALLRQAGVPFRAQEIDPLQQRQAVLDALALTRALLHPGDRLAWCTLLRAPWCGLDLADLHALCGAWPYRTVPELATDAEVQRGLSPAGRQRLQRTLSLLAPFLAARGRLPLRRLVEGCWLALSGPACYAAAEIEDVAQLFRLLERLDAGGEPAALADLEQGLKRLYAVPESGEARVQVMTIHKAKGLQFDRVFLPGLGKPPQAGDKPLLRWLETVDGDLLLAPVPPAAGQGEEDPIYRALGHVERDRGRHETLRLLYVAATRAVKELVLAGHADTNAAGALRPAAGSLLERLWPVASPQFVGDAAATEPAAAPARGTGLRRLRLDHVPPPLAATQLPQGSLALRPSAAVDSAQRQRLDLFTGYEAETARHVGSVIHRWLERIGREGLGRWPQERLVQAGPHLRHQLAGLGLAGADLQTAVDACLQALQRATTGRRGRWILQERPGAAVELSLAGRIDGQLIHAMVDRTFVEEGIRWIIDYKTGRPETADIASWKQAEWDRYRPQMELYQRLMSLLEPERPIRCGLYFPAIDGWIENIAG